MPSFVIDLTIVVLIAGIAYALMSEGLWGSALMFMNALFAGLIAFNFYEPLAALLSQNVSAMSGYADTLCLLLLFIISLLLLRLTTESIGPAMVRFPTAVYHLGRIIFALGGATVTMAILLLAYHTAPVHKKMFGVIDYAYRPPFKQGLDIRWLSFFQYTSGQTFAQYLGEGNGIDRTQEYRDAKVFDPDGRWLIDHQNARPYGSETVPATDQAAPSGDAGGATPEGGGGAAPAASADNSPRVPGGTAGAAVGLAPTN